MSPPKWLRDKQLAVQSPSVGVCSSTATTTTRKCQLSRNLLLALVSAAVCVCAVLAAVIVARRGTVVCADGRRLSAAHVNDGFCDCGIDEPLTSACSGAARELDGGQFVCANAGYLPRLIPSSRVGDGVCDCCSGADERAGVCNDRCAHEAAAFVSSLDARIDAFEAAVASNAAARQHAHDVMAPRVRKLLARATKRLQAPARTASQDEQQMLQLEYLYYSALSTRRPTRVAADAWLSLSTAACLYLPHVQRRFGDLAMVEDHYLFQVCPFRNATQFALRRALTLDESTSLVAPPWSLITDTFALGHWVGMLPDESVEQIATHTPSMRAFAAAPPAARAGTEVGTSWADDDGAPSANAPKSSHRQRNAAQLAARVLAWRNLAPADAASTSAVALPAAHPIVALANPFAAVVDALANSDSDGASAARAARLRPLVPLVDGELSTRSRWLSEEVRSRGDFLGSRVFTAWYGGGLQCWQGPPRNAVVKVFCSRPPARLVSVTENGKCSYEFELATPLACADGDLRALREVRGAVDAALR